MKKPMKMKQMLRTTIKKQSRGCISIEAEILYSGDSDSDWVAAGVPTSDSDWKEN